MNVAIYPHAIDLREIIEVICYPASDLRSMNAVIYLHANALR